MRILQKYYHRIRLTIWAILHLPRKLYVADTPYFFPAWNWMVACICKVDTSVVKNGRIWYEPESAEQFKKMAKGVFYDVGTMIGYYSLLATHYGAEKVIGFELVKECADFANKVLKLNGIKGYVIHCGIGSGEGEVEYTNPLVSEKMQAITLDSFRRKTNEYPDSIKMDIEGHEYDALLGARDILKKKPAILIETHTPELKQKGQNVFDLLGEYKIIYEWSDEATKTYFLTKR